MVAEAMNIAGHKVGMSSSPCTYSIGIFQLTRAGRELGAAIPGNHKEYSRTFGFPLHGHSIYLSIYK